MLGHRSHGGMCSLISPLQGINNALLNGQLVLTKHLAFLYFSRQIAENEFQLKSPILYDIAFGKKSIDEFCVAYFYFVGGLGIRNNQIVFLQIGQTIGAVGGEFGVVNKQNAFFATLESHSFNFLLF